MLDDRQFARLLEYFDYSWQGYRKVRKGVKKRVARHMQELACRNVDEYIARMESDSTERQACNRRMTVSISRFFRDRYLWHIISERVLPERAAPGRENFTAWFAGCAGGEEVYSFRILWEEYTAGSGPAPELRIIAADLNPEHLERAQKGVYPKGTLREMDDARKDRWLEPCKKEQYAVRPLLKEKIEWRIHDLLTDEPPGTSFDIVFLRNNLLTYYQPDLIREPLDRVIDAVSPGGFLVIGSKEQIPGEKIPEEKMPRLERFDHYVYRKAGRLREGE